MKAWRWRAVILAFALVLYARPALGSFGDHLPEFKECLEVGRPYCLERHISNPSLSRC